MNRIEERFAQLKERKEKAFITYITAGYPDLNKTKELLRSQQTAGTDIVELGIPFSDPTADGPVIQNASYQSILNGTTLKKVFSIVKELREEELILPIVFMLYYNTILAFGVEEFVKECVTCGVDGLIIPDLPYEEQDEINQYLKEEEDTILIQLVSPVSKKRIPTILKNARGFVYCVSSMGVTGGAGIFHKEVRNYLEGVKKESKIPVMMGFGIRDALDVKPYADVIDGAIVGTYFIQLFENSNFQIKELEDYTKKFKKELNAEIIL